MNGRQTPLSSHRLIDLILAREKISELRQAIKRDAITAQKDGDDYSTAKLRNAANLLIKAERELSGALKGSM
tara:strand:- start:913 stop:1128 length:216 start_codon:yes stop_codon:yes gene_type:complete